MYVCMYVCMYVYMYVCMYECMYLCMFRCMYVYIAYFYFFLAHHDDSKSALQTLSPFSSEGDGRLIVHATILPGVLASPSVFPLQWLSVSTDPASTGFLCHATIVNVIVPSDATLFVATHNLCLRVIDSVHMYSAAVSFLLNVKPHSYLTCCFALFLPDHAGKRVITTYSLRHHTFAHSASVLYPPQT
jgi:hypothetical protein